MKFLFTEINLKIYQLGLIIICFVGIYWYFSNPKNITNDTKTTVTITGQLTNYVTNYSTTVKKDTKYVYITNSLNTSVGDAEFATTINREHFAYNHQFIIGATAGYNFNSTLEFGLGLEYLYKKHKIMLYADLGTKQNYGLKLGYGYVFYRR